MNDEEIKAFITLKKGYGLTKAETKIISNLIEKQQKIIDEMADNIFNIIDYGTFIDDIEDLENETKVKQYFYRKVEEDG